MLWQYILQLFGFLLCLAQALPSHSPTDGVGHALERRIIPPLQGPPRGVTLHLYFDYKEHETGPDGKISFPWHTAVEIAATPREPSLFIDIMYDGDDWVFKANIDKPYQKENPAQGDDPGSKRFSQGFTKYTNYAIIDDTNNGPMWKAVTDDPIYRSGPDHVGNTNTCHNFASRMLNHMGITVTTDVEEYMSRYEKKVTYKNEKAPVKRIESWQKLPDSNSQRPTRQTSHDIPAQGCGKKRSGSCAPAPSSGDPPDFDKYQNELINLANQENLGPDDFRDTTFDDPPANAKTLPTDAVEGPKGTNVAFARAAKTLKTFTVAAKPALVAAGVLGDVVGALFVILDFINGDWVGGAIGAVATAVGIIIGLADAGPVGWLIGGLIAAFFALLPGLFKQTVPPPDLKDVQGIIQYKFFGDPKHTGNEKCQNGDGGNVPKNPDCQALYGAGALTQGLGFSNFDAMVFLTKFNDGYPMTIKDMAQYFHVLDPNNKDDTGAGQMALINCGDKKPTGPPTDGGLGGRVGGGNSPGSHITRDVFKFETCDSPTFSLNRPAISLDKLGTTADKIYDRMISDKNPNGDCKLIAWPGTQFVQDFNVTLTGLPSSIACGLSKLVSVDGTEVPFTGDTPGGTNGSQSTDGQGGAYVKPTAPDTGFAPLAQKDYGCIYQAGKQPFCLPPGTYAPQTGLGFEMKGIDTLTLPAGWTLTVNYQVPPEKPQAGAGGGNGHKLDRRTSSHRLDERQSAIDGPQPGDKVKNVYNSNQNPGKNGEQTPFALDMDLVATNFASRASFQFSAPNDGPNPTCCIFTEVEFGGDVWCIGVGGGSILPNWVGKPQSVSCHGGGQAWLYADHYGDQGGIEVRGDVPDLTDEPYGPDKGTFSKNVKALWVLGQN